MDIYTNVHWTWKWNLGGFFISLGVLLFSKWAGISLPNLILVLNPSLLQFFSAKSQITLWQGCFFSLSLSTTAQGQWRKTENTKSSATVHVSGYLLDTVTFFPKVTLPNVLGGNCTLALIIFPACYEFLPYVNTDMCASTVTTVYPSPENQRKATISVSGLGQNCYKEKWNLQLKFATVTTTWLVVVETYN